MEHDIFKTYRDEPSRERKNAFSEWLLKNCERAVSYEALRVMFLGREKGIARCLDKLNGKE